MAIDLKKVDAPSWERQSARVTILDRAGFSQPAAHQELKARWDAYEQLTTPVTEELVAAIVSGAGDVASLRAAARAEHVHSALDDAVGTAIAARLGEIVTEHAADIYKTVQTAFNKAATAFAKGAAVVDPETSPEDVLSLGDLKAQEAWRDSANLAAELDRLLLPLIAAATNAGVRHPGAHDGVPGSRAPKTRALALGLAVDASGVENYRHAWDAVDAVGRTGAWGELLRVGAKIRAVDLADFQPARIPKPKVQRKRLREDQTYEFVELDPEDPSYVEVA
ncbi:hypothetical protein [Mycolicibacterium fortuitum]|uniref:hypothetical protein n=1 Tax=Mycolicibacterium fortuitum TaxID=1766 RepID=UPI00148F7B83|nr:hypothetical protein [Mycolicibacterium fortuitum]